MLIPCIVLYCIKGLLLPVLVEYSYKGDVNLTHLFCLKDANGSAHMCGACPLLDRYVFIRPFFFDEKGGHYLMQWPWSYFNQLLVLR